MPGAISSEDDPQGEGCVYGLARVSLIDLLRGSIQMNVEANILPRSTIRGAGSLQWYSRPGIYVQVKISVD